MFCAFVTSFFSFRFCFVFLLNLLLLFCTSIPTRKRMNSSSFPSITLLILKILPKTLCVFQPLRQCCFKLLGYLQGLFILRGFDETFFAKRHMEDWKNCGKEVFASCKLNQSWSCYVLMREKIWVIEKVGILLKFDTLKNFENAENLKRPEKSLIQFWVESL